MQNILFSHSQCHSHHRAFTLIELLIVVAVVAILAAVALPAYHQYVDRSRRVDAKSSILNIAQQFERCFTRFSSYDHTATNCPVTVPTVSAEGFYRLTVTSNATSFTITATPTGVQAIRDAARCPNFTYDQAGTKGGTVPSCWD